MGLACAMVGFISEPFHKVFVVIDGERIEHCDHRHEGGIESEVAKTAQEGAAFVTVHDYEVETVASTYRQLLGGKPCDAAKVDGESGFLGVELHPPVEVFHSQHPRAGRTSLHDTATIDGGIGKAVTIEGIVAVELYLAHVGRIV